MNCTPVNGGRIHVATVKMVRGIYTLRPICGTDAGVRRRFTGTNATVSCPSCKGDK